MGETKNGTMLTYVVAIVIPLAVGMLSAFLTSNNMMIFAELNKPPLAPPAWLQLFVLFHMQRGAPLLSI